MSDIKIIKLNNIYGRIITEDFGLLEALFCRFAYRVQNYFFTKKYKAGVWDGKIHFVEKSGKFYLGHLFKILNYIKSESSKIIVDPAILGEKINPDVLKEEFNQTVLERINPEFIPRAYQIRGALKAIYHKRGIIEHCTGSGKSFTIALVCNYLLWKTPAHKILLLVPNIGLVDQMKTDLVEYGIPPDIIGKFYGYEKTIDTSIVVSTWQSMMNYPKITRMFTVFLCDEAHGLKAEEIKGVALQAFSAEYRIGFTGTLPDDKCEYALIEGNTGRVLDQVTLKQLIAEKSISDLHINMIILNYPIDVVSAVSNMDYAGEKDFICNNLARNKALINLAMKHAEQGQNVLILVNRINHGETLLKLLEEKGIQTKFIYGKTDKDDRQIIRKEFENESGKIVVASNGVFAVGVSIKKLHVVIFGSAGKSKIRTLQTIGRGVRLHESKVKLQLYDISENFKYSEKHSNERKKYYKKNELSFKEREIDVK